MLRPWFSQVIVLIISAVGRVIFSLIQLCQIWPVNYSSISFLLGFWWSHDHLYGPAAILFAACAKQYWSSCFPPSGFITMNETRFQCEVCAEGIRMRHIKELGHMMSACGRAKTPAWWDPFMTWMKGTYKEAKCSFYSADCTCSTLSGEHGGSPFEWGGFSPIVGYPYHWFCALTCLLQAGFC